MKTLFILDREHSIEISEKLKEQLIQLLNEKGHTSKVIYLDKKNALPCRGCLLCLTKNIGVCVSKDKINDIKLEAQKYDMTVYITPVIFGHFSSTIKNAIDRGTGSFNLQIIIGYGDDIYEEEKNTFVDLTARHRGKADIVHPGMDKQVDVYVTTSSEDSKMISEKFKEYL
jgi:multimeric flavodoxin WrbA